MSKSGSKSFWKLGECVLYDSGAVSSCAEMKSLFVGGLYLERVQVDELCVNALLLFTGEGIAHSSDVNCLSLSPSNGRMLVTGGDDRKINLWVIGKPNAIMVSDKYCTSLYACTGTHLHVHVHWVSYS